ncbi:MAG: Tetratricopeptide repeat [Acidobacteriota bacterium]|nr:Tetratricopeptide repeat [Acidobacteriota bacterium]
MVKPCPGCGAATVPEARFCRLCGAPLHVGAGARENDAPISPLAQTIPLTGEGRATDGLNSDEARRAASDTSRVGRAEMENLLRRAATVPSRQMGDGDGEKTAQQTTMLVNEKAAPVLDSTPPASVKASAPPQVSQPSTKASSSRRKWQVLAIVLLCVALVAGLLAFILSRRASSTDAAGSSSPISISDQKQLVSEKLAEAEVLLGSGEFNRAITVLRAAVKLDPSSVEAHMRLGDALEKTGARSEAIDEYRAAAQSDPNNRQAWRSLASAQFAEKLYNDAAESYRRLIETTAGADMDDETRLAYADALRLAERPDEARAAYQKISASATKEVAQAARQHLAELGPAATAATTERPRDETRAGQPAATPEVVAPTATPTPQASATPATAASGSAQSDADAYYFKALNIVNGRDPKKLSDGELTAALNYFLRAQNGTHGTEARRNADRLGREYDRRRKR